MHDLRALTGILSASERNIYHKFARLSLPRHTSYPAVPFWSTSADRSAKITELSKLAQSPQKISLYVHVPFCEKLCHYCACNKLVIGRANVDAPSYADQYLSAIEQELNSLKINANLTVQQLHFGGGTPTWLNVQELKRLWNAITNVLAISDDAEISVELDPRVTTDEQLHLLREFGVNRLSMGIQDFDPAVQQAIQRIQPFGLVERFVETCRNIGFQKINFDLIYGLPRQTPASLDETIQRVVLLRPDRIAFYRLALLPDAFKWQRTFATEDIPDGDDVLNFALQAIQGFGHRGYQFLGLDHFALYNDDLAIAHRNGTMHRNFQGMTTGKSLPMLGIGSSSISYFNSTYFQNDSHFHTWKQHAGTGTTAKVYPLLRDDLKVKWVMDHLYTNRRIDKSRYESIFEESFHRDFAYADNALTEIASLGLIENNTQEILVRPILGWLLMRVVAAAFDQFLERDAWKNGITNRQGSRVG